MLFLIRGCQLLALLVNVGDAQVAQVHLIAAHQAVNIVLATITKGARLMGPVAWGARRSLLCRFIKVDDLVLLLTPGDSQ